jgi:hypothetical protein
MGTSQRNRLVSETAVHGPLPPCLGWPECRPAKPRARDPPRHAVKASSIATMACAGHPYAHSAREPAPHTAANEERRCSNIASPERRTRKS